MAFGSTPTDINNVPVGSIYVPGTGFKAIQGGGVFTDASSNDSAPFRMELASPSKSTYISSVFNNTVPTGAATDIFTLTGSASKTIRLIRIEFSMTANANVGFDFQVMKRSSVDSGGTTVTTNLKTFSLDSANAGASATILLYSVVPSGLGTLVGPILINRYVTVVVATTSIPQVYTKDWGNNPGQAPTLRGTSEQFAFHLNSAAFTTGVTDMLFMWTEE